jgi:hypothetical protein
LLTVSLTVVLMLPPDPPIDWTSYADHSR